MADFEIAYRKLLKYEGIYSNDSDDKGGETYKGISRVYHPDWEGWEIIDKAKREKQDLSNLKEVEGLVKSFYKKNYWDYFSLDRVPQLIGEEIFEIAVNCGIKRTTLIIQQSVNLLNRNQALYSDVLEDGIWGEKTLAALFSCFRYNGVNVLFNVLNILQGCHYINLMRTNPKYEKFIGWFNRIEIYK